MWTKKYAPSSWPGVKKISGSGPLPPGPHPVRVGTLTSIGRSLYPAITELFAKRQPGWQVELHSFGWGDSTAGLQERTADAAFVWLPIDAAEIETAVLATERRFVAISARHRLAGREAIEFSEIISEPVSGLEPARLAVAWRRGDPRPAVRDFVRACREAAAEVQRV